MNLYHVQFVELEDIGIFAKDGDEAQRLVDKYLLIRLATASGYQLSHPIELLDVSRMEFYQLQAAFAKNLQGYGVYDSANGWDIVPLTDHALCPKNEPELDQSVTMKICR